MANSPEAVSIRRSCTVDETEEIGGEISNRLRPGDIVGLRGNLGTGKSVLARAIARSLGITERMPSPSYTLVEEYNGVFPLLHVDLYRLADEEEFEMLGLQEAMDQSVSLVEWIDRAPTLERMATAIILLEIDPTDADCRRCTITWHDRIGDRAEGVLT